MSRRIGLLFGLIGVFGLLGLASADFLEDDEIPAYVLSNGAGSSVDVRADGTHDGAEWTLVLTRNLQTGDTANDIQMVAGGTYSFQVATWDNSGDEAHDISELATVYQMTIPAAPGALVFSGTPGLFNELSGEYLSSDEIQITVKWADSTKNDQRKRWSFDGSDWAKSSSSEDRVAFIWDMQGDGFSSAGTCATMCHTPFMYTAAGTKTDTWQWKGTRTNPAGYADDKYWDDGAGGTASGRHSDPGEAPFKDNDAGATPAFMAETDPGANANFLFDFEDGVKEGVAWTDGAWSAGDVLPAYVGRRGSGSRADTRGIGTHDGSAWTVMFRRKLDTGDSAQDIVFAAGNTYSFQVATWDNAGDAAHDLADMSNTYQMTIPAAPGPLAFSGTPVIFTSISGELLDSDELEITISWPDATKNDIRRQWSFDGATWSKSSEEQDRVAVIWDMQNDDFSSAGTCATMCHPPNMYTASGFKVDTWHWKAAQTGAFGFTDDKYFDDGAGGTSSGRHADPGTVVFDDNSDNDGVPTYMSAAGPGHSARLLFMHAPAAGWSRAIDFDAGNEPTDPCLADAETVCLVNDRFKVTADWATTTETGTAKVSGLSLDEGEVFYFFNENNPEMLVKVKDACSFYNRFWVFMAATTNVEFTLDVVDTMTGATWQYHNPQGTAAVPVQDTEAFVTCP